MRDAGLGVDWVWMNIVLLCPEHSSIITKLFKHLHFHTVHQGFQFFFKKEIKNFINEKDQMRNTSKQQEQKEKKDTLQHQKRRSLKRLIKQCLSRAFKKATILLYLIDKTKNHRLMSRQIVSWRAKKGAQLSYTKNVIYCSIKINSRGSLER